MGCFSKECDKDAKKKGILGILLTALSFVLIFGIVKRLKRKK